LATWESWDADVFGGHYIGHHGNGPNVKIEPAPRAGDNAIFKAAKAADPSGGEPLVGHGSLYRVSPLAGSATPLLVGSIPGKSAEPVAWINQRVDGGKSFYTSLGHPDDFSEPVFRKLLVAALHFLTGA